MLEENRPLEERVSLPTGGELTPLPCRLGERVPGHESGRKRTPFWIIRSGFPGRRAYDLLQEPGRTTHIHQKGIHP